MRHAMRCWRVLVVVAQVVALMAFTLIATASGSTNSDGATTASFNSTGADLLIVHVASHSGGGNPVAGDITDSKGNTFTALSAATADVARSRIFYALAPTVGAGHTVTVSRTATYPVISVQAWSGAAVSSPFDQQNGSGASGVSSLQPGSVTPSEDDELVVAGLCTTGSPVTIGSGFTEHNEVNYSAGVVMGGSMAYLVQTSAAAVNPTWSGSSSFGGFYGSAIATFKAEPDVGPGSPEPEPEPRTPATWMGDLWTVEGEFDGRNNGWTDWSADVMIDDLSFRYGLMGNGPNDLVAGAGLLSLVLDNGITNTAALEGYYSPHHANKRSGFAIGMGVRLSIQVPTYARRYKFVGTIEAIMPIAGAYGRLVTLITVSDWLDYAAITKVNALGIQLNQRSDELFLLIVESLPIAPRAVEIGTGKDTYPFAFDNMQDESRTVLTEFNRLAQSERGRIYIKGDAVQGGTLTFEPRGRRITTFTNVDVFTDVETVALDAPLNRSQLINRAQVITNQRRLGDTDDEVLYDSEARISVEPGATMELFAPYRDPLAEAERISAIDVQEPVAGTDFTATENEDGTGTSLTASVTVDVGDDGNGAHVEIVNASAMKAWVWFRILGRGLYTYRTTVAESSDDTSIANQGQRTVTIDMPYQSSAAVATAVARYTVRMFASPLALPVVEFTIGADEDELLDRVMRREIGDRIGLSEQVTGISTSTSTPVVRGYFINAIEGRIVQGSAAVVRWTLQPSDITNYWRVGINGSSNVGTMMVAPGQIIGHGDQVHGDSAHSDVAHSDTAHSDTAHADEAHIDHTDGAGSHQDTAHADVAHVDADHVDIAHEDTAHEDVAHVDTIHVDDAHGDTAHGDVTHQDTHQDSAHGDTAHVDVEHEDHEHGDHDDVGHQDHEDASHGDHTDGGNPDPHDDTSHVDDAHDDTPHDDIAHADEAHTDVAHTDGPEHVDSAHGDDAHGDDSHEDTAHEDDAHSDTAHGDTDHSDTAHADHTDATHGDVAHGDTAHVDVTHSDTAHSDFAHADSPHVDE